MKPNVKQAGRKRAFTIIELLTVMSIIVILIGLLLPAMSKIRRYAAYVRQKAQLHSIDAAIELYNNEFEGYPESNALDPTGAEYPGAMKLCEAIMGQDLLGIHTNSVFRADGFDAAANNDLYPDNIGGLAPDARDAILKQRKGPFLQTENANAYRLEDIYGASTTLLPQQFVLCDVFERSMASGKKTGMPILYFKADTANNQHDWQAPATSAVDRNGNIYNCYDNMELLNLGKPWESTSGTTTAHKLADPRQFYWNTTNHKIDTLLRPYKSDMFILLSAGWDGEYGTADDVYNFPWKYEQPPF